MQLNQAEFTQLQSSLLSHMARSLYIFCLQPQARQQNQVIINLPSLAIKLTSQSSFAPCKPTLKDIKCALNELEQHHLIARNHTAHDWQGAQISFPLFDVALQQLPQRPFAIYDKWMPGPNFRYAALNAGLLDYRYTSEELTEFINYWSERHDIRTQSGWERLFIRRLIKIHTAAVCTPRNYLRPQYDNFASRTEAAIAPNPASTRYDWEQKFLPQNRRPYNLALRRTMANTTALPSQALSATSVHSNNQNSPATSATPATALTAPAPVPPSAPKAAVLPAATTPSATLTPAAALAVPAALAVSAPSITATAPATAHAKLAAPWEKTEAPTAAPIASWPAAAEPPATESLPFYPDPYDDTLIEDPSHLAVQPTTFREKRPTLAALYTGKEEYTVTATGYTAPQNYEDTQNKIIGRMPTSTAQGYTPPEVLDARAQNLGYTGRPIEQDAPQPQFAAITNDQNASEVQLSDYGFTPLELPSAQRDHASPTPEPLPHVKPKN